MSGLPDEELPRRLDAAERDLAIRQHRWFGWASLLAAIAGGVALLLPWIYSRRLGQSVWQLGVETQPALALVWLAGAICSLVALVVRPGVATQAATAFTGVLALTYAAGGWQGNSTTSLSDTWPGPGPAFALVTGGCWLLCSIAQLLADRPRPGPPDPEAVTAAVTRLRRNRRNRR